MVLTAFVKLEKLTKRLEMIFIVYYVSSAASVGRVKAG